MNLFTNCACLKYGYYFVFVFFSLSEKEAELETLNKQKSELNNKLEETKKSAETAVTTAAAPAPALDESKLKELEDALAEREEKNKKLEENVESMKAKNNVSIYYKFQFLLFSFSIFFEYLKT